MAGLVEVGARLVVQERARYVRELEAGRDANQKFGGSTERAGRQARDAGRGFDEAGSKARGMGGAVAAAGRGLGRGIATITGLAATASAAAGAVGIRTAAQLEQARIGFTTMLGSAQKADAFLGDLSTFAAKTPFEFPELQTAASSLVSAGIEASKVIPIMTSLGNATSGMGTGAEGVKRATVALQQMNAAGKITGEDLNQLRDAGIPVYDLLAAATGKSKEAVAELASKGKLGRQELEQLMGALESGKGLERFTGLMEAQSQSLTGLWSTLQDTFSMGMAEAIQPAIPMIKDGLGGAITQTADLMPHISAGLQTVVQGASDLAAGFRGVTDVRMAGELNDVAQVGERLRDGFDAARTAVEGLAGGDMGAVSGHLSSMGDSATELVPAVQAFAEQMPSLGTTVSLAAGGLGFLADNVDTLIKYMPLIVGGVVAFKVAQMAANVVTAIAVPLRIAEVLAQRALVKQLKATAAAQVATTATTTASTVATVASTTATSAGAAASKRGAVGMRAMGVATRFAMGPVGWIITGVAALAAGLVYAYKHSETFRDLVNGAFRAVGKGAIAMVDGVLGGIQWMMEGLGKLPGPLGAPFRAAAGQIETARGKLDDLSERLDGFGRKRVSATVGIVGTAAAEAELARLERRFTNIGGVQVRLPATSAATAPRFGGVREQGGPVTAGSAYVVGERRAEMFVPKVDGVILPEVPRISLPSSPRGGDGAGMPQVWWTGDLHVHPAPGMDERELATLVADEFDRRHGRR